MKLVRLNRQLEVLGRNTAVKLMLQKFSAESTRQEPVSRSEEISFAFDQQKMQKLLQRVTR